MGGMGEAGDSGCVPRHEAAALSGPSHRPRRGRPHVAPLLVPEEEGFGGGVGHGVVREGREAVLAAVLRPRIRRARCRDHRAESWVGDDVDPGERRLLVPLEDDCVLAPAVGESARPIGEGEGRDLDLDAVRTGGRSRGRRRQQLLPPLLLGVRPIQLIRQLAAIPAEDRPGRGGEQAALRLAHAIAARQVHPASPRVRAAALGSRYLCAMARAPSRRTAIPVWKDRRTNPPGARRMRCRRLTIGSSTAAVVPERARPSRATGSSGLRPRPRNRPRSVSHSTGPCILPSTLNTWTAHTRASSRARGRRAQTRAALSGKYSVSTKSLLKAGWVTSSATDAKAISA